MRNHYRYTIRELAIIFILIYSIMPIIGRLVSRYTSTYAYMLLVLLVVFFIVCGRRYKSINLYFNVLIPMILYVLITFLTISSGIVLWGYQSLLFLLPIILGYHIIYETEAAGSKYIKVFVFALVITILTTIIGVIRYPNAARVLATTASSSDPLAITYNMCNIGGYGFVYTIVLLYPILILAYKRNKIRLWVAIVGAVAAFMLVIFSEYTIALLLLIITSTLFFMKKGLNRRGVVILIIVSIIAVIILNDVVSDILSFLANAVGSEQVSYRLNALAGGAAGIQSSEDNRIGLYLRSLSTFIHSPICGSMFNGGGGIGGHSQILDTMAQYGLIGFALVFLMFRKIYRLFFQPFVNLEGGGYVLWAFVQTILLATINTGFWFSVTALYMPILLSAIYGENDEDIMDS